MFDIGFWELFILFGIGLMVLGPERLPRVAMKIGSWAGQARRTARTLTTQLRSELDLDQSIGAYQPRKTKTYSRPGADDLKPGAAPGEPDAQAGDPATERETPAATPVTEPETPAKTD
jgi:sec-independent protein translocase protein TatB